MGRNLNIPILEQLRRLLERESRNVKLWIKSHFGVFLQLESCLSFARESPNLNKTTISKIRENGSPFKLVLESGQIQLSRIVGNHLSGFLPR